MKLLRGGIIPIGVEGLKDSKEEEKREMEKARDSNC